MTAPASGPDVSGLNSREIDALAQVIMTSQRHGERPFLDDSEGWVRFGQFGLAATLYRLIKLGKLERQDDEIGGAARIWVRPTWRD